MKPNDSILNEINSMLNKMLNKIEIELGKIKGIAESLKAEIDQEKLNRQSCRKMLVDLKLSLFDLESSLEAAHDYLSEVKSYFEGIMLTDSIKVLLAWKSEFKGKINSILNSLSSLMDSIIQEIDTPSRYKDEDVRKRITCLVSSLDHFIITLSDILSIPLTGMAYLQELISIRPLGLNENWAAANCYLSAMEIVVNKKLKEEEVKTEEKDFASRFRVLLKVLENKGIKVSELEKELPSAFWKLRNQVVHAGYSPTQDELNLIITWVKKIIMLLLQI